MQERNRESERMRERVVGRDGENKCESETETEARAKKNETRIARIRQVWGTQGRNVKRKRAGGGMGGARLTVEGL